MSTSNGQAASAAIFNAAYVSRTSNTSTIGVLNLNNVTSGDEVTNAQESINSNIANIDINSLAIADNATDIVTLQNAIPDNNFAATADPVALDDQDAGYIIGTQWINTLNNKIFQAVDVSPGAAIWKRVDTVQLKIVKSIVLDMSVSNVTDAAYVELDADVGSQVIRRVESFYPTGSLAHIATGAAAAEVDNFILIAGGNGEVGVDVEIAANSRLSIKLVAGETSVTGGKIVLNLFAEV